MTEVTDTETVGAKVDSGDLTPYRR
jgi:hypothetical protein